MRIQIEESELFIELNEKDLLTLSQQFSLSHYFKFSILDDEHLHIILKMEGSGRLCTMYDSNELIIFLPFNEFEKWLNSDNTLYHSKKGVNGSNNMHITLKKTAAVPRIKTTSSLDISALNTNNLNYN